jgi:hypothetical protein
MKPRQHQQRAFVTQPVDGMQGNTCCTSMDAIQTSGFIHKMPKDTKAKHHEYGTAAARHTTAGSLLL